MTLIVKPDTDMMNNFTNSLLNSNSESLTNSLKTGSLKSTAAFINSFTLMMDTQTVSVNSSDSKSILPPQYYLDLLFYIFKESEISDQAEKNSNVKEVLINVMASMPSTDVNSIILISNTLSTLTSKTTEINLNAVVYTNLKNS